MLSQVELELQAYSFGKERMEKSIARNEEKGVADNNPYAQAVYRRFVLPLADALKAEQQAERGKGKKPTHLKLLEAADPEPSAFVAVRAALVHLMGNTADNARIMLSSVGSAVYHELLLREFDTLDPKLFHSLANGAGRNMYAGERYRLEVFRAEGAQRGVALPEWEMEDIERVGAWFSDQLATLGMLSISTRQLASKHSMMEATLSEEVTELIDGIRDEVVENAAYFLPCVEKPKDWESYDEGGWHTDQMRRLMPYAIKTHAGVRHLLGGADLSKELACLNTLQATRWRINRRILSVMSRLGGKINLGEVLAQGEEPRPDRPAWLLEKMEESQMDEDQLQEFRTWKRLMALWHARKKKRVTKWGRYRQAMDVATRFADYENLYFVYFCDFRGRKYAMTTGVSPQGSDLQKALLEFAKGKPLHTKGAKDWFCITGANRYGYDKVDLGSRIDWVHTHHEFILSSARDPANSEWWLQASKPLQFLAWCMEYSDWQEQGESFESHLSAGMDGSCNGLQNFSAMLRDEVGGEATNLVPRPQPQDIYGRVGKVTEQLLLQVPADPKGYRDRWLAHGVNRSVVKRSVMTLPYGSTRFSCADFILKDYLNEGLVPEFNTTEYAKAAQYLSKFVWKAIGDVVVKAREAMDWLQVSASELIKSGESHIFWTTPTGFPVMQVYWEEQARQIETKLCGRTKLWVRNEVDRPDKCRHKNGISPNFVHSMDASHLTAVTNACAAQGITDLHMVHDDFGAHCADAPMLYSVIREEFVRMYASHNPMQEFQQRYPQCTGPLPSPGTLDIQDVLDSPFFFS
uniref:DNA-directed RNA polymerase n=1 Tax=Xanthomonas phage MK21 TaxID=3148942 RepID=A0AAU7J861_9CAUD